MSSTPIQKEFRRQEIKYILDRSVFEKLQKEFKAYLIKDNFAHSTITNVYFDNPDYQMIKDSINHLYGSEKIRVRTYDAQPSAQSQVFLEIKKKELQGEVEIGRKYRLTSNPQSVYNYVQHNLADDTIADEKVGKELAILRERYEQLVPKMYIHYKRFSMRGIEDPKLRVTFDRNILYRHTDVSLTSGHYGQALLDEGKMIMEVKVRNSLPDWMEEIFNKYQLLPQSFSKYTNAYLKSHNTSSELVREEASSIG